MNQRRFRKWTLIRGEGEQGLVVNGYGTREEWDVCATSRVAERGWWSLEHAWIVDCEKGDLRSVVVGDDRRRSLLMRLLMRSGIGSEGRIGAGKGRGGERARGEGGMEELEGGTRDD